MYVSLQEDFAGRAAVVLARRLSPKIVPLVHAAAGAAAAAAAAAIAAATEGAGNRGVVANLPEQPSVKRRLLRPSRSHPQAST